MDELMEMLSDYVTLSDRVACGANLSAGERARVMALSRLIPGTGSAPAPSDEDGGDDGAPVQVTGVGGFETARLVAVSRDGMRLCLAHPLPAGAHTIVRVLCPRTGFEYTFPCRVAWREPGSMGLAFDGCPSRAPLSRALMVGWQRLLDLRTGWGSRPGTDAS